MAREHKLQLLLEGFSIAEIHRGDDLLQACRVRWRDLRIVREPFEQSVGQDYSSERPLQEPAAHRTQQRPDLLDDLKSAQEGGIDVTNRIGDPFGGDRILLKQPVGPGFVGAGNGLQVKKEEKVAPA